jgi:hypothetical protein
VPKPKPVASPQIEEGNRKAATEDADSETDEPTEDELAAAGTDPDSPEDFCDADDEPANTVFQFEE